MSVAPSASMAWVVEKLFHRAHREEFAALEQIKELLSNMYKRKLVTDSPLSLPFTFDVNQMWKSPTIKFRGTEKSHECCQEMLQAAPILIIEGAVGSGKTTLLRRVALNWANGQMSLYKLVLFAQFKKTEVPHQTIINFVVAELVSVFLLSTSQHKDLKTAVEFLIKHMPGEILVLLDGFENAHQNHCNELEQLVKGTDTLQYNALITSRPARTSKIAEKKGRFERANILGFLSTVQQESYIKMFFKSNDTTKADRARDKIMNSSNLTMLAQMPLFLCCICLFYEYLSSEEATILELYKTLTSWLLDRDQRNHPQEDIPKLFGYESKDQECWEIIQDHWLDFPLLRKLSQFAFEMLVANDRQQEFSTSDLKNYQLNSGPVSVGLLQKNKRRKGLRSTTVYTFPHSSFQDFFATLYCCQWATAETNWWQRDPRIEQEAFIWRMMLAKSDIVSNVVPLLRRYEILFLKAFDVDLSADNFDTFLNILKNCNWLTELNVILDKLPANSNITPLSLSLRRLRVSWDIEIDQPRALFLESFCNRFEHLEVIQLENLRLTESLTIPHLKHLHSIHFQRIDFSNNKANLILIPDNIPTIRTLKFDSCRFSLQSWTLCILMAGSNQLALSLFAVTDVKVIDAVDNNIFDAMSSLKRNSTIIELLIGGDLLTNTSQNSEIQAFFKSLVAEMNSLKSLILYFSEPNDIFSEGYVKEVKDVGLKRNPKFDIHIFKTNGSQIALLSDSLCISEESQSFSSPQEGVKFSCRSIFFQDDPVPQFNLLGRIDETVASVRLLEKEVASWRQKLNEHPPIPLKELEMQYRIILAYYDITRAKAELLKKEIELSNLENKEFMLRFEEIDRKIKSLKNDFALLDKEKLLPRQRNFASQRRMADDSENSSSLLNFVEQAKYCFESYYPNWRKIFTASPDQKQETICIPDALDVLNDRRLESRNVLSAEFEAGSTKLLKAKQALRKKLINQTGEDKFAHTFRQLKLGGVLISGFDTQEFISKLNKEDVSVFDYEQWKKEGRHFECDDIFFHHNLGAFVAEVKAFETGKVDKRINEAAKKLERSIAGIKELYCTITGKKNCPININGVICIPNADVESKHEIYTVLGKTEIESEDFEKYWITIDKLPNQISEKRGIESVSDDLFKFLATIICYRSAKFVSMPSNVLEIYRIIDQQEFTRIKRDKISDAIKGDNGRLQTINAQAIVLNKEQLRAVECTEKHVVISGPPGTGKTTVMLLRALEAAKIDKPGRVIVISGIFGGFELACRFRKFIADNWNSKYRREIIVTENFKGVFPRNIENLENDLFCDEMPVRKEYLSVITVNNTVWGRMDRSMVSGTTTIVMTGLWTPSAIANDMPNALSFFPGFHPIELKTVIRGTLSIINEWRRFFPADYLSLGHNVRGAPVERIYVPNRFLLLNIVERTVISLLQGNYLGPQHIAILVSYWQKEEDYNKIIEIKNFLNKNDLPCDSIDEQIKNKSVIAIGLPYNALSFDWPVVIYIAGKTEYDNPDDIIAYSRCISKLFIVTEEPYSAKNSHKYEFHSQ